MLLRGLKKFQSKIINQNKMIDNKLKTNNVHNDWFSLKGRFIFQPTNTAYSQTKNEAIYECLLT